MTNAYNLAQEQIKEIAEASDSTVQLQDETIDDGTTLPSGYGQFDISIRFDGLQCVEGGLPVRARERFRIFVPPTFPFVHPLVATPHLRFSGFPHVQWRRHPCLYASSADWRPEDGMYGFIKRLDAWIRDAALNNLDPEDAPLHPPVAYSTVHRLIVPKVNAPLVADSPWFGLAELRERHNRTEIIGWKEYGQERPTCCAPAILLHKDLPFEYPDNVNDLLKELESHDIDYALFIFQLASHARHSDAGTPLTVVIGTPMRRVIPKGRTLQHLAVWEISAGDADKLRDLDISVQLSDEAQRKAAITAVVEWSITAKVGWCMVREMRPEVTNRRDFSSPMAWFRGKRVAIWGCGAVGTHVAESVVRAGAAAVELADNKTVTPGILVRQGFEDADIGRPKAYALAERLKRIEPDLETVVSTDDLIHRVTDPNPVPKVDLIIDCTASLAIRTALERTLRDVDSRPAIASISIDSQATTSMATLSMPDHSGGVLDLIRRLKLEACQKPALSEVLEAFWPKSVPDMRFQPEPGCSEPTFIGSNADLAGLSARMLNSIARAIATSRDCQTGMGWLLEESGPVHAFTWPPDHALRDKDRGYSVRVCSHAAREMRGWARRSARMTGPTIETGGLVFGELNEAAGVLWVTDVEGPPPDSNAGKDHFTCGTEGMEEAARERHCRFRGSVECVGSWHTHPTSAPHPSHVDLGAVAQLLASPGSTRRTCLVLILSGNPNDPILGAHAFRTKLSGKNVMCIQQNAAATARLGPLPKKPQNVGLALSGGGSRAIAFHLGCLRALHDLDLLDRIQVISSVSGGSVISAMYAYSNDSFQDFDKRVIQLLRQGLCYGTIRQMLKPIPLGKSLPNRFITSMYSILHLFIHLIHSPARKYTRTEAFRNFIAKSLFGNTIVRDVARPSLHTVEPLAKLREIWGLRLGA